MTTQPEAITKSWHNCHDLFCADCGFVGSIRTDDLTEVKEYLAVIWRQHLEEKHHDTKPI